MAAPRRRRSTSRAALRRAAAGRRAGARCVRSELVTVPSFSPQASAGSSTCAKRSVSVLRMQSETTTSSQAAAPRWTRSASGRLTTGLVAMIHTALMRPSCDARRTARPPSGPAASAMAGLFQNALHAIAMLRRRGPCARRACWRGRRLRARPSRWAGRSPRTAPCPACRCGPVSEVAVDDGVDLVGARARTGSRPARTAVTGAAWRANRRRTAASCARVEAAGACRRRAASTACARGRAALRRGRWCARRRSRGRRAPCSRQQGQQAVEQQRRRCRRASGRCRSAISQVAVRRGSITTIFMSGRCSRARSDALQQDGMAPRGVGADQHDEIGVRRGPRSSPAPRLRRTRACGRPRPTPCTAASWCRCWRADVALHQLVGDVVVLGQQLAGHVEAPRNPGRVLRCIGGMPRRPCRSLHPSSTRSPRTCGCSRRPSRPTVSPSAAPLRTACRHWPDGRGRRARSTRHRLARAASTPQPTPQ